MSILLEALRKSEKGQTPVVPPTIHTDQHITMADDPVRKWHLAALLLPVLLLIAWIVWRQYEPADVNDLQPQASPAEQESVIESPVVSAQVNDVAPGSTDSTSANSTSTDSTSTDSTRAASSSPRTPVEGYQPETPASSAPANSQATTAGSGTSGLEATKAQPPATAGADRQAGVVSTPKPAATGGAQAKQPQPISYWELPDAIRADVPEIKFSVLVYATQPADRFVLVNGQRLVEGDSYAPGLVVAEIRLDGVVFSYRLYRFLVER